MRKFFKDFAAFISKGSIIDLAIGVVIGGAFNKIVNSLVNDIIMPCISCIVKKDVTDWKAVLIQEQFHVVDGQKVIDKAEVAVRYGVFIQNIVNFLIIALSLFVALRIVLRIKKTMTKANEDLKNKLSKKNNKLKESSPEEAETKEQN